MDWFHKNGKMMRQDCFVESEVIVRYVNGREVEETPGDQS